MDSSSPEFSKWPGIEILMKIRGPNPPGPFFHVNFQSGKIVSTILYFSVFLNCTKIRPRFWACGVLGSIFLKCIKNLHTLLFGSDPIDTNNTTRKGAKIRRAENLGFLGVYVQFEYACLLFQVKNYLVKSHDSMRE